MSDNLTTYSELAGVLDQLPLLLREARRARGVGQRAVAAETGVNVSTISRFENGEEIVLSSAVKLLRWMDGTVSR